MTIVHANGSFIIRYSLASYKFNPIDLCGLPITSAAIPDLKLKPRPREIADIRKGRIDGKYIDRICFHLLKRNTLAISINFLSVLCRPWSKLENPMGHHH